MIKIFLCTSFSGHVDYATGRVKDEYRQFIESVLAALRADRRIEVFCAIEYEQWIATDAPPEAGAGVDLQEIDHASIVVAIPPSEVISAGLQYEIGYADGIGKDVFVAHKFDEVLAHFTHGVVNLGRIREIIYNDPLHLAEQVKAMALATTP